MGSVLADLRALLALQGFRRLFTVRLVSQSGDGMFQVGLATLFFFSATSQGTAEEVAIAFAVLLAPFTIVGPFAGVFLDRWRRRQVLLWGNLTRVALTAVIAVVMLTSGAGPWIYVLALLTLSVNRFLLAALSAAQPRVVDGPLLLTANSLAPTLGAVAAGAGGLIGFVLGLGFEPGRVKDSAALVCAAVAFAVAAGLATRMDKDLLGPDRIVRGAELRGEFARTAQGLADGARYLWARRTPGQALTVMATHRFVYGVTFIASILISRNVLADPADTQAGLAAFGSVLAASGLGFAFAVLLTPTLSPRTGPHLWIAIMLCLAAGSQVLLAVTLTWTTMLVGAVLLGLAAQGAKIAVDTIVQRDTDDAFRGRAFALYDVLYNAAFVGAAALAALALPDSGYSPGVFAGLAVVYVVAAVVYGRFAARTPADVGPVDRGRPARPPA
ncbi:MFS transporter [Paraoerskovia marina]|uniref:MFS transporter n=1 Tax=Paraoerskovia marina TaxID=545619 RepID=UPI00069414FF|nr:MFS transporter [Paraoerskovia marina]